MRWVRASLPLIAVSLLAGCGGDAPAAAPRTTQEPSPTRSAPFTVPTRRELPRSSPVPPPPSPTPSGKPAVKCGEIPTKDPAWYWREEAVPPATCAQAKAVLPKMMNSAYVNAGNVTVSGWRCSWEHLRSGQVTGNVICTKGSGTIRAVYLHREK
jgi:hypothetical protein